MHTIGPRGDCFTKADKSERRHTALEFCYAHLLVGMPLLTSISRLISRRCVSPLASHRLAGIRSITTTGLAALPRTRLFEAIKSHDPESTAVIHSLSGRQFSYGSLLRDVAAAKQRLANDSGRDAEALQGERVAFLVENSYDYVGALCSCFLVYHLLGFSFPCCTVHAVAKSGACMLAASSKFANKADDVLSGELEKKPILSQWEKIVQGSKMTEDVVLEDMKEDKGGMMLYTSGTTNRPKGVLLPQSTLMAQAKSLSEAWHYSPNDHFLHVLPLHHIHGTVNALLTPLLAGSTIEFLFPFTVDSVWSRLAAPFLDNTSSKKPITFFTVVPTIYNRLLQSHNMLSPELQAATKEALDPRNMRLNISGSAALPTPTKQAWTELSNGNVLLERYGMTEVGMALSCGMANEDRVDGSVGWPLPSVEARLVDLDTKQIIQPGEELDTNGKERNGEIQLRGPTIFKEYWNNPTATAKEFTKDRFFKTGDVAVRRNVPSAGKGASGEWAQGPMYFILGRLSADIIKVGGEKVSALEVEREILSIPAIAECAVVGLPSETWGQKVAAVVVLSEQGKTAGKGGKAFGPMDLRRGLKDKLAPFKIPQDLKLIDSIPRNAMGKINKKQLVIQVFGAPDGVQK
ncbi:acetyl-CoA synthetase-like protein [Aureobasidium pullulans]|uniref:Acetyl-CoA synthetase-like protein n=1 Tax=Aureobasidium pullulans TaxID=5580 RepID=A0A4S8YZ80_AURPU|nr:acetyl-CoA synthetase-like protein [Aureobasidium pullulans]